LQNGVGCPGVDDIDGPCSCVAHGSACRPHHVVSREDSRPLRPAAALRTDPRTVGSVHRRRAATLPQKRRSVISPASRSSSVTPRWAAVSAGFNRSVRSARAAISVCASCAERQSRWPRLCTSHGDSAFAQGDTFRVTRASPGKFLSHPMSTWTRRRHRSSTAFALGAGTQAPV
jgi:hypothetical protein